MIGRGKVDSVLKYHAIGFDLNHTLVRYRLQPYAKHIFDSTCVYLVNQKGYPQDVYPPEEENPTKIFSYFFRAVYDQNTGFVLKIGASLNIMRAFHGYDRVSNEELFMIYGNPPVLQGYTVITASKENFKNMHNLEFACYIPILIRLVELKKKGNPFLAKKSYPDLIKDIEDSQKFNHSVANFDCFKTGVYPGYFLPRFLSSVRNFTYKMNPKVLENLLALKKKGAITYIATSGYYHVGNIILNFAMGKDWDKYFTFIVFEANKHVFFDINVKDPKPFKNLSGEDVDFAKLLRDDKAEKSQKVLLGGHVTFLSKYLFSHVNKNYLVAFVGDSIVTDCNMALDATMDKNYDSVLILEELQEIEYGLDEEEYFDYKANWGSALVDRNVAEGGVEKTAVFEFADSNAQRTFSKLDSDEALEFLQI